MLDDFGEGNDDVVVRLCDAFFASAYVEFNAENKFAQSVYS